MIDWKELSNEIRQTMPDLKILEEEPLARHTSFRIGGPAAIFAQPATVDELSKLLRFLAARGISPRILGAGTNVLAPDEGLREVVICTKDALTGLRDLGDGKIEAFAGETLSKTAVFARNLSLTGLEFAHGIPGTVGGGIYMNAGAYGGEMKQVAMETTVLTMDGETRVFAGEAQGFAYRTSAFENLPVIIVKTVFQLAPGEQRGNLRAHAGAHGKAPCVAAAGASLGGQHVQAAGGCVCWRADSGGKPQGRICRRRARVGKARGLCRKYRRRDGAGCEGADRTGTKESF